MPNILLTHPVHGSKFAMSDAEVEHDEKFGWTRYTETTPSQDAAPVEKVKRKSTRKAEEPAVPEFLAPQADQGE